MGANTQHVSEKVPFRIGAVVPLPDGLLMSELVFDIYPSMVAICDFDHGFSFPFSSLLLEIRTTVSLFFTSSPGLTLLDYQNQNQLHAAL